MLVGLVTASIGEPSTQMADPSRGPPLRSRVGNFSDRGWGISVILSKVTVTLQGPDAAGWIGGLYGEL
jgi:hypothetical protein